MLATSPHSAEAANETDDCVGKGEVTKTHALPRTFLVLSKPLECSNTTPIRKSATCGIKAPTCSTIDDEAPALCSYTYLSTGTRFDEVLVRRFGFGSRFQFPLPVIDRDQKSRTPPSIRLLPLIN
jgi:hypothetical protein